MTPLPNDAIRLAEQQLGVIARSQLLRWSSAGAIDGARRRGRLITMERGAYRIAGGAVLPMQEAIAAALRAHPDAIVTGPRVLADLRVDAVDPAAPFDILLPPGRRVRSVDFATRVDRDASHRRTTTSLGDVRIASAVDALVDSTLHRRTIGERSLRVAFDQLRWRGLISTDRVARRLDDRGPDDPAVRVFRELFDAGGLEPESEGERALAPIVTRLRPIPEPQVWVTPKRRVDWYLRCLRLGWEYLGSVDHASADRRRADAVRDRELSDAGVRLLDVTAGDLRDPAALLATTVAAVVSRAEQLGVEVPQVRGVS